MSIDTSVDPELCIGSGDCTRVAPRGFRLDDDQGVSIALPDGVASTGLEVLLQAARGCPTQAITVISDGAILHRSSGR